MSKDNENQRPTCCLDRIMTGYGFFRTLRFIVFYGFILVVMFLFGLIACIGAVYSEITREITCHQKFGSDWVAHYQDQYGSLGEGQFKILAALAGAAGLILAAT